MDFSFFDLLVIRRFCPSRISLHRLRQKILHEKPFVKPIFQPGELYLQRSRSIFQPLRAVFLLFSLVTCSSAGIPFQERVLQTRPNLGTEVPLRPWKLPATSLRGLALAMNYEFHLEEGQTARGLFSPLPWAAAIDWRPLSKAI